MTALALLQQLHPLGVMLTPYPDGTLRYKAPKGVLTPALLAAMRQHKDGRYGLVEAFEERAGLMEYASGLHTTVAEQLAWQCVLGENPQQSTQMAVPGHRGDKR